MTVAVVARRCQSCSRLRHRLGRLSRRVRRRRMAAGGPNVDVESDPRYELAQVAKTYRLRPY